MSDTKSKAGQKPRAEKPAPIALAENPQAAGPKPRLQTHYAEHVRPTMQKEFNYKNPMQVPRLEKIVINMGVGEAAADQKILDSAVAEMTLISGQRPVKTIAKKAIAGFKIRAGCMSSLIGWSPSPCRACATSVACPARVSMAAAISPWA